MGLGLGLLLIAARELRNSTFRAESHVTGALNLPVLATVPRMLNARERRRHVVTQVSASLAGVVVVVAAAAAAAAWRWLK